MSDDDYKMGQQGLRFSPGMNRQDFDRGKADKEDQAAFAAGNKTDVSGAGIGLIMMAPILAFMYPIASAIVVALVLGAAQLVDLIPDNHPFMKIGLLVAVGLAALFPAGKAEHKVSEFKLYRISRHIFRLIAAFGVTVGFMIRDLRDTSFDSVLNNMPPATLFAGLVAVALMAWLGPRFDRFFFPVRDAYAIKLERKYAGMSDLEIDDSKLRESNGRFKMLGAWLGITVVLVLLAPNTAVIPISLGVFVVFWVFRRRLFYSKAPVTTRPT